MKPPGKNKAPPVPTSATAPVTEGPIKQADSPSETQPDIPKVGTADAPGG